MEDVLHGEKTRFVAKLLKGKSGRLLDVGCFKGELGLNTDKNLEYFGLDVDSKPLEEARKSFASSSLATCDLDREGIPFKGTFDFIAALDVLEHTHDPAKVLAKLKSVLIPNGTLLISLPNDYHLINRLRFFFNKPIMPEPFWVHTHLHVFTMKQAEEFLKKNGLLITRRYYLPGTKPRFLPFGFRMALAKFHKSLFCRSVLYICKNENSTRMSVL
jgi:2-polyprenyl-3-methyl-5-hydroxy-6-metoxy-1,4-benzoquinol methylase